MAKIESPRELFVNQLGAAYKMENEIVGMLEELEGEANSQELKQQLAHHRQETQQQIRNLERAFQALGVKAEEQPCPVVEGLEKEGKQNLKQVDDQLNDAVILAGAAQTEAHEIAVYDALITHAEAMGEDDVVALFQENLEQEQHTLKEVRAATKKLAQREGQKV